MQFRLFASLIGFMFAVAGPATAQMKDRVLIPAPIPDYGAVAVPGVVPVPEGFTYYLRADLGWGFSASRTYSENGALYGGDALPFLATSPFGFGGSGFIGGGDAKGDGVFLGTVGYGAYFTPRFRGDLTIDFRSSADVKSEATYTYLASDGSAIVNGLVTDKVSINNAVMLANLYWDLLPRGFFTPYVGASLGFVYYDATRTYIDYATASNGASQTTSFSNKETGVSLAAALMAGSTFAIDQNWLIDVNYRALYLGEVEIVTAVGGLSFNSSRVTLGSTWEHQARIGLRYNIW
jgi:opacity protein-like surface antigen